MTVALSPVQKRHDKFLREYLKDFNGTQAAIRAGYSKRTANEQAARLLAKVSLQTRLATILQERIDKEEIAGTDILRELKRIGLSDVGQAFDEQGRLKPMDQIPEDLRRSIAGVESVEEFAGKGGDRQQIGWTKKVKLWDKPKALEILCKHLGLLQDAERPPTTTIVMVQKTVINGVSPQGQITVATNGSVGHESDG